MLRDLSYHDVVVHSGGVTYHLSYNYTLELRCTRARGWSLWQSFDGLDRMLCEEFGATPMLITAGGVTILDTAKRKDEDNAPEGDATPMTDAEQVKAFVDDLTALVKRYSEEFNLTTAAAIGEMEIVKHQIISQGLNPP